MPRRPSFSTSASASASASASPPARNQHDPLAELDRLLDSCTPSTPLHLRPTRAALAIAHLSAQAHLQARIDQLLVQQDLLRRRTAPYFPPVLFVEGDVSSRHGWLDNRMYPHAQRVLEFALRGEVNWREEGEVDCIASVDASWRMVEAALRARGGYLKDKKFRFLELGYQPLDKNRAVGESRLPMVPLEHRVVDFEIVRVVMPH